MTPHEAHAKFYNLTRISIPFDGIISAASGKLTGDIFKADKMFAQRDRDYNDEECTYKGIPEVSMMNYIQIKWGKYAVYLANIIFEIKIEKEVE